MFLPLGASKLHWAPAASFLAYDSHHDNWDSVLTWTLASGHEWLYQSNLGEEMETLFVPMSE